MCHVHTVVCACTSTYGRGTFACKVGKVLRIYRVDAPKISTLTLRFSTGRAQYFGGVPVRSCTRQSGRTQLEQQHQHHPALCGIWPLIACQMSPSRGAKGPQSREEETWKRKLGRGIRKREQPAKEENEKTRRKRARLGQGRVRS